jgi:hypothetical protein
MKATSEFLSELYLAMSHIENDGKVAWNFGRALSKKEIEISESVGFRHKLIVDNFFDQPDESVIYEFKQKIILKTNKDIHNTIVAMQKLSPIFYMSKDKFKKIIVKLYRTEETYRNKLNQIQNVCKIDLNDSFCDKARSEIYGYIQQEILDIFGHKYEEFEDGLNYLGDVLIENDNDNFEKCFDYEVDEYYDILMNSFYQSKKTSIFDLED